MDSSTGRSLLLEAQEVRRWSKSVGIVIMISYKAFTYTGGNSLGSRGRAGRNFDWFKDSTLLVRNIILTDQIMWGPVTHPPPCPQAPPPSPPRASSWPRTPASPPSSSRSAPPSGLIPASRRPSPCSPRPTAPSPRLTTARWHPSWPTRTLCKEVDNLDNRVFYPLNLCTMSNGSRYCVFIFMEALISGEWS